MHGYHSMMDMQNVRSFAIVFFQVRCPLAHQPHVDQRTLVAIPSLNLDLLPQTREN